MTKPAEFETHGVLSACTGILMGDIGELYKVASYLLDRPAYTHELAHYGKRMQQALLACHPELPGEATSENWQAVRDSAVAKIGKTIALNPSLSGVLADDRSPLETLADMGFKGKVVTISPDEQ